jgi:hypothetical protein
VSPEKYLFAGQGGGKYSTRGVLNVSASNGKAKINKDVGIIDK